MLRKYTFLGGLGLLAMALTVAGCNDSPPTASHPEIKKNDDHANAAKKQDAHAHKPGSHSGTIVAIGQDSYHAEVVFEKEGVLRFFTLGADESKLLEVEAEPLQAFVKASGAKEAEALVLRPEPQAGDAKGKTTLFVGQLPRDLWGKKIDITIPNFRVGDERFRVAFSHGQKSHVEPMPKSASGKQERKLYLEPGGIYTAADIKANGNVVASEKFKGVKPKHDMNPKSGDKICPITETKANAKFTWIVAGKAYEFCCPPCVDEFVTRAKTDPTSIKAPEEYVKQ